VSAYADFESWLERCEPYRETVQAILQNNGVSADYYYLMVAESRCSQMAVSKKGAFGFWQLTRATSIYYGCRDPMNIECSTIAASKYLAHLERSFDRFELVIMGYNMGGRNLKRGKPTKQASDLAWTVKRLMAIHHAHNKTIH
jgi:membrane-bound lytic murein transglycosylase D